MADLQSAALASWLRRHFARILMALRDLRQASVRNPRPLKTRTSPDWIGQSPGVAESIVPKIPTVRIVCSYGRWAKRSAGGISGKLVAKAFASG
jgi:hypothetical protein